MKRKLWLCCLVFGTLAACSKKDKDNAPSAAAKYLTQMTQETGGITTAYTLSYDDKKRLTAYVEKEEGVLTTERALTYDASGRLVKLKNDHPQEGTYEEYTFTYNAAGVPEKYVRKISDDDGLKTTINGTYTIANGKVTRITEKDTDPENPIEIYMDFTYAGNNVTKVAVSSDEAPTVVSSIELTHGGKKNPLRAGLQLNYALLSDLALEALSENETLTMELRIGNNVQLQSTTTYQYDAQGYPTSSEEHENGSNEVTKTTYQYK
ncbi:hypothetical protein ACFOTA_18440 [Chitinophaga sp. GCM10012297]|uniref:DUF4595 domain-containing protein n=1 Tax=Chitinophaga chungangae TaxID=2821488 RepID=A0ABS3YHM7_9BACT|nr:hypothetical protein [Chitinophaga chungangae]MBO9154200.1 hypothetical protein [Chitinophaga chungangae]